MKLIIAILRDEDSDNIIETLIKNEFRVTRIASTGGFLRKGMTTMMIGIEDEKVDEVFQIMRDNCAPVADNGIRRATMFVLNVDRFTQV
jgi:uncharacterized protein YaaQ